jgi:hypothetical protein
MNDIMEKEKTEDQSANNSSSTSRVEVENPTGLLELDRAQGHATKWQKWLFGIGIIVSLLIFVAFVLVTISQINNIQKGINNAPILEDSVLISTLRISDSDAPNQIINKNLFLLENETIKKRYHNANVILKSQILIKYLGFLTGMILSVLGAIFVLGKFRENPIVFDSNGKIPQNISMKFQSTSPGIFLALIGAIIMMTTIINKTDIRVDDGIVYVNGELESDDTTKEENQTKRRGIVKPPYFDTLLKGNR